MLLDEDPAALISSCAANFNIAPDRSSLARISESLSTLQTFRQHHLASHKTSLQKLSRQQQTLASQHVLTTSQHDAAAHAAEILRLDTEKFKVAKQASDLEIEGERLGAELQSLRAQLAELEAEGIEEGARNYRNTGGQDEDETILKLKIYRSLGIDVEPDSTGAFTKAVVRNTTKGDVHVINMDPRHSRMFYANWFWRTL